MLAKTCRRIAAAGGILALVLLIGCERYESDIDAVKAWRSLGGMTNAELAIDIGGERSAVAWEARQAPAVEGAEAIEVVAVINRTARGGQKHEVRLRYVHDRSNGQVTLRGVNLDGVIVDLMTMPYSEFKLRLE